MTVEYAKNALRISHNQEDAEIGSVIESATADLMTAGVTVTEDEEPLITTAIVFYLRAYFNFEERGERYERDYEKLKALLSHNYDVPGGQTDV